MKAALAMLVAASLATECSAVSRREPWRYSRRMDRDVTQCFLSRRPALIRGWLATLSGSSDEKRLLRPAEADFPACFYADSEESMTNTVYNYAKMRERLIAALLWPIDLPDAPPPGLNRPIWWTNPDAPHSSPEAAVAFIANGLGFCLAKSDWQNTVGALAAAPGSPQQRLAIDLLVPKIASCIPRGKRLTLDRSRLLAILAETVYHALGPTDAPAA